MVKAVESTYIYSCFDNNFVCLNLPTSQHLIGKLIFSANGGSLIKRPPSGKHYSLSIEAPITKVINIILAAQENQPTYIVQALDKVLELTVVMLTFMTFMTL